MEAMAIIAIINVVLAAAFKLWDMADQIKGDQKIPSWEELIDKNKLLQAKIDAEMKP